MNFLKETVQEINVALFCKQVAGHLTFFRKCADFKACTVAGNLRSASSLQVGLREQLFIHWSITSVKQAEKKQRVKIHYTINIKCTSSDKGSCNLQPLFDGHNYKGLTILQPLIIICGHNYVAGSSVGRCGCLSKRRWTRNSLVATEAANTCNWKPGWKIKI